MMKKLLLMATLAATPIMATSVQAADSSTKVTFAKDSYCGNFTGNIKDGKVFRLWLAADQNLVIRNVGDDRINVAYVSGPSGRLDGDRYDNETSYITESKGNHYMKVYGNSYHSSVEFCAY
ncbi:MULTISPECIES: hypothetical protein [Psychrobacter]|uniref:hypothetical protein n=3 Tax=Moraxellaceae TaxID=468 RepID=UPI002655B602|nr:hypothetical protein [Psychrobacter sp.]